MRLNGQVAVVTGGGRGIGRAVALALAKEGANVVVCARTQSEIDAVAAEIQALGRKALAVSVDVTAASQVEQLVEHTVAELDGIDILVNSAGGFPSELYDSSGSVDVAARVWEMTEASWDRILDTNLKSVFLCMRAVIPHMIERGRGNIVNIASQAGRVPYALGGAYPAAKHAVIALTQAAAQQAAAHGVRVNAVSPSIVDTPGQRRLMAKLMPEEQFPPMDSPEFVAAAVLYLLCDGPTRMTGQSLDLFTIGQSM
jgi:3-oxoacyl-[acyl-carrier protein] reductase